MRIIESTHKRILMKKALNAWLADFFSNQSANEWLFDIMTKPGYRNS